MGCRQIILLPEKRAGDGRRGGEKGKKKKGARFRRSATLRARLEKENEGRGKIGGRAALGGKGTKKKEEKKKKGGLVLSSLFPPRREKKGDFNKTR